MGTARSRRVVGSSLGIVLLLALSLSLPVAHAESLPSEPDDLAASEQVIDSLTTPYQEVRRRPDGSFLADLSAVPVRVQGVDGNWGPIDTSLELLPNGDLKPRATLGEVTFSGGGSSPLALLPVDGGAMALDWPGTLSAPTIDGSVATYADVMPGVDLLAEATAEGFATYLVVKTPEAAASPALNAVRFDVDSAAGKVETASNGTLSLVNPAGEPLASAGTPIMWDSSGDSAEDEVDAESLVDPAAESAVSEMDVDVVQGDVVVRPDQQMLDDPATEFPVVIDPVWSAVSQERSAWGMVWSNGMEFYNDGTQNARVGYETWDQNKKTRSFYKFTLPSYLNGATINSATFRHEQVHSPNHGCRLTGQTAVQVYRAANFGSGITWPGPALSTLQDTDSFAVGHRDYGCGSSVREFSVVNAVRGAVDEGYVVLGMKSANESDSNGWRQFDNDSNYPHIAIEYNRDPKVSAPPYVAASAVPAAPGATTAQVTNDQTPTLKVLVSDPDASESLTVCTYVKRASDGVTSSSVCTAKTTAGGGVVETVSQAITTTLPNNAYDIYTVVTDQAGGDATSAKRRITVDTIGPVLPTLSLAPPAGGWTYPSSGSPGTLTLQPGGTSADTSVFKYTTNGTQPGCGTGSVGTSVTNTGTSGVGVQVNAPYAGESMIRAVACDAVGNPSAVATATIIAISGSSLSHSWTWNDLTGIDDVSAAAPFTLASTGLNAPTYGGGPGAEFGGNDKAVNFAASDSRLETSANAVPTSSFSVWAVARIPVGATGPQVIASSNGNGSASSELLWNGSGWSFAVRGSDGGTQVTASVPVAASCALGSWCIVVGAYDAYAGKALVGAITEAGDGAGGATLAGAPFAGSTFAVGASKSSATVWSKQLVGEVSSVKTFTGLLIWQRQDSSVEIDSKVLSLLAQR